MSSGPRGLLLLTFAGRGSRSFFGTRHGQNMVQLAGAILVLLERPVTDTWQIEQQEQEEISLSQIRFP